MKKRLLVLSLVTLGAALSGNAAFAECPSCSSVKSMQTAIFGVQGVGAVGDVISVEKMTTAHGSGGGTYRVKIKFDQGDECQTVVKVTRYSKPNDPPGAAHFRSKIVSTTCTES